MNPGLRKKEIPQRVLVFGTFDILHPGHSFLFGRARKYGKRLYVVVARDDTVVKVKGKPPVYSEKERLMHIKDLDVVFEARLGSLTDRYEVIEKIRPDVICLGYDQKTFTKGLKKALLEKGLRTRIIRFRKAHHPEVYKSSKFRKEHLKKKNRGSKKQGK
jgi:FAD synthetase